MENANKGKPVMSPTSQLEKPMSTLIKLTIGPIEVIAGLKLKAVIIIANSNREW